MATSIVSEIIAHRGAGQGFAQPGTPPENTLPAFLYAWSRDVDADAAEVDVHLTRDGEIVAIHDETTERTAGAPWRVAERTLAELRTLDAGSWKGARFAGIRLPTLEEVLATVPVGKRLYTEIKCGPEIVDRLARVVRASGLAAWQVPVISFDFDAIRAAKQAMPEHECYLLVESEIAVETVEQAGLDGIDFFYECSPGLAGRLRARGLKSVAWTVNEAEIARRLLADGVGGITTDLPRQMRAWLVG